VAELDRNKAEIGQSIQRKEKEFSAIMAKIEDEASLGTKQQKQIKELSVSLKIFISVALSCVICRAKLAAVPNDPSIVY
jgi:hypothetical protein